MKSFLTFKFFFYLLLIVCIFDPADKLFNLKSPLYLLCIIVFFYDFFRLKTAFFPINLVVINVICILLPLISIFIFFIQNFYFPIAGFDLFKSYILIFISIILYYYGIDVIGPFSIILLFLSFFIIVVYFVVTIFPESYTVIYVWGLEYQIFLIGERSYSLETESIWSIYFVTSPMLVISISYFIYKYFEEKDYVFLILAFINIFAMFIAGTRNNMLISLILPFVLIYKYTRYKLSILVFSFITLFFIIFLYSDLLGSMISLNEASNFTKLGLIDDYLNIFSNPLNLIFGQGLGSSYFWVSRGRFDFITELTYLEIFRSYGIFLGFILFFTIFYPVFIFLFKKDFKQSFILIAYFFYLIMAATNPIYFMSMGMLFFPIVLTTIFNNFKFSS